MLQNAKFNRAVSTGLNGLWHGAIFLCSTWFSTMDDAGLDRDPEYHARGATDAY